MIIWTIVRFSWLFALAFTILGVKVEVLITLLRGTFTVAFICVKVVVAWAFLHNTEASTAETFVFVEEFLSWWAFKGFTYAVACFKVKGFVNPTLLDDAFTATSLDAPCLMNITLFWHTSALAKGLVPHHIYGVNGWAVVSLVALTAAVVEIEMVVVSASLLHTNALTVDGVPCFECVVAVLHFPSASTVVFAWNGWTAVDSCVLSPNKLVWQASGVDFTWLESVNRPYHKMLGFQSFTCRSQESCSKCLNQILLH